MWGVCGSQVCSDVDSGDSGVVGSGVGSVWITGREDMCVDHRE